jgi:hypothetical protein
MEIGIDSFAAAFTENSRTISASDRLRNLIEQIERADQVGLDSSASEHGWFPRSATSSVLRKMLKSRHEWGKLTRAEFHTEVLLPAAGD